MRNSVQHYAWGSHTVIPELLGEPTPSREPYAELWMGAHPTAPSRLADGTSLVEAAPGLPYLLKVLAAEQPLSLQAHPSLDQARAGHAAEEARGVPTDAANRSYRDANHKPELLCALTPVEALCGFREPSQTRKMLEALEVPALLTLTEPLTSPDPGVALRQTFSGLVTLPESERGALVEAAVRAATRLLSEGVAEPEWAASLSWAVRLHETYPQDIGVVSSLLLNVVELAPGEGVYLHAGILHAYLHGAGVEIMASSDNVLRGGLTPKYVDVAELLNVLEFCPQPPDIVHPEREDVGIEVYRTPAPDFALRRVRPAGEVVRLRTSGPQIVLCVDGWVTVDHVAVERGQSVFVFDADAFEVGGSGTAFVASPGKAWSGAPVP
jgi:mannose-6-phosphate isomerase